MLTFTTLAFSKVSLCLFDSLSEEVVTIAETRQVPMRARQDRTRSCESCHWLDSAREEFDVFTSHD